MCPLLVPPFLFFINNPAADAALYLLLIFLGFTKQDLLN